MEISCTGHCSKRSQLSSENRPGQMVGAGYIPAWLRSAWRRLQTTIPMPEVSLGKENFTVAPQRSLFAVLRASRPRVERVIARLHPALSYPAWRWQACHHALALCHFSRARLCGARSPALCQGEGFLFLDSVTCVSNTRPTRRLAAPRFPHPNTKKARSRWVAPGFNAPV
jgi:hypothetical protein